MDEYPSAAEFPLRWLVDSPSDGPTNMARDETMLENLSAEQALPMLRFYRWSPATISLGYFQPYADYEKLIGPTAGMPVVRRTTGGGAILHDRELTYALAVPRGHRLLAEGPVHLYVRMHEAIIAVCQQLGVPAQMRQGDRPEPDTVEPFFCFARAHPLDVVTGDRKLAGSAQRRMNDHVLQHGSLILDAIHGDQPSAGIHQFANIDADDLAGRIATRFAANNGLTLVHDPWQTTELHRAAVHRERYSSPAWTRRR